MVDETLSLKYLRSLSFEKIERLQNIRFRAVCRYLLPEVPAYKKLFKQYDVDPYDLLHPEDWKVLPLIKKLQYMKHPQDFIVQPKEPFETYLAYSMYLEKNAGISTAINAILAQSEVEQEIRKYLTPKMPLFSGGTESGRPTPVFITAKQKQNMQAIAQVMARLLKEKYLQGSTVGMNLFPYGPHLAWHAVHTALDEGVDLNLSTAAGGAIPTERLVQLAHRFKPRVIAGMAQYLKNRFLPEAARQKVKLSGKVVIVNGASKLYAGEKEQLERLVRKLGGQPVVLDCYGASELKEDLMPECAPGTGFHHIAPLSNIIKTVRITSPPRKASEYIENWEFSDEGYAVTWNIDGAGTVLQGYLLGDIFEGITKQRCSSCKTNTVRIKSITRIKDIEAQLWLTGMVEEKVKGTRINLAAVRSAVLKLKEVQEVQIVLRTTKRGDQLIIKAAPAKTKQQALSALKKLAKQLEVTPTIQLISLEKLLAGKDLKFKGIVIEQK